MNIREAVNKWIKESPEIGGRNAGEQIRYFQAYEYAEVINDEPIKDLANIFMDSWKGYNDMSLEDFIEDLEGDYDDNGDKLLKKLNDFYNA